MNINYTLRHMALGGLITTEQENMNKKYRVYDITGAWLRSFDSWKAAYSYCIAMGRLDWTIR